MKNCDRTAEWFKYILLTGALAYIAIYLFLAFHRIGYPFELEWMEGGAVDHVRRILAGQKLYAKPSLEFVPFIYTPLYFYISALASKVAGVGFIPLRLVSFLASLGCFAFIFLIVKRETGGNFPALLAAGLFAATFRLSGAWFDIARVDSLFLCLVLWAVYVLIVNFEGREKKFVWAGLIVALAFLTKQTTLVIFLPIAGYFFFRQRRRGLALVGAAALVIGITTWFFDYICEGWYSYYIFDLPRRHPIRKEMFVGFWTQDLMRPLPIACLLAGCCLLLKLLDPAERGKGTFYLLTAVGMLGGAWLSRLHSGGYDNVLFPAYAVIAVLFGLSVPAILDSRRLVATGKEKPAQLVLYLACAFQFILLGYRPSRQIPTSRDLRAGKALVRMMGRAEGEVLLPYHGYLPVLAGKNSYAHAQALADVLRGSDDDGSIKSDLARAIKQAIRDRKFGMIILEETKYNKLFPFEAEVERYYTKQETVFSDMAVFWPVTGARMRPGDVYIPGRETERLSRKRGGSGV